MFIIELITGRSVGISCTSKYLGIGSKTHDFTFLFEGGNKMVTLRKSKRCIYAFLAISLVYGPKSVFLIGYYNKEQHNPQEPESSKATAKLTFIYENTTSTIQLRQTIKQNYNHFAAKRTHWRLRWCNQGGSH